MKGNSTLLNMCKQYPVVTPLKHAKSRMYIFAMVQTIAFCIPVDSNLSPQTSDIRLYQQHVHTEPQPLHTQQTPLSTTQTLGSQTQASPYPSNNFTLPLI